MRLSIACRAASIALTTSAILCGAGLPAMAANVSFVALHYSADRLVPHFHFDGPVVEGDAIALSELIDEYVECDPSVFSPEGSSCAVVTLNSPGGNYHEGLRLAALMRERAITTMVEQTDECYSACAFAFLGGSGYSTQSGIGAYIDRIIEPGGVLGFHAPYFAPDSLDGLVAQFGLDDVLGASRGDIALMVQQLVDWNVNPNALSYIVNMGPDQSYDIDAGEDFTLIWAQLPPAPLLYWNSNPTSALRNACTHLLAYHQNTWPDAVMDQVPPELPLEVGLVTDEQGRSLTGFRLGSDNPLGVTYCALPDAQADLSGDVDLALYSAPGISGGARPIVSLFNRADGWSTMGTGSEPTRRKMQKGSMSHLFVDLLEPIQSDFVEFMSYLPLSKFGRLNDAGMLDGEVTFPLSDLPMRLLHQNKNVQVMTHGQNRIVAQAGSELLYNFLLDDLDRIDGPEVILHKKVENGYIYGGTYPSGRPYMLMGLRDGAGASAVLRIETPEVPQDNDAAVIEQVAIACGIALNGYGLDCL